MMTATYRNYRISGLLILGFLSKCYYNGCPSIPMGTFQLKDRTRTSERDCLALCGPQTDGQIQNKSPKGKNELVQQNENRIIIQLGDMLL